MNREKFDVYHVGDFSDACVEQYAHKWFTHATALDEKERDALVGSFLEESRVVADLRKNPLMLALMCIIYRGNRYIPRNRPDIYEKCATLLFDKWDHSRGINPEVPFEAHFLPAIMHLAHWIYTHATLQGGVTESALIDEATQYLCPKQFDDRDEARAAAKAFVNHCRGRAWVFTDSGTTADGESLYKFTHTTFLEYFTAAYLVRVTGSSIELVERLYDRIGRREWDVVAQLAFQLFSKARESGANDLLEELIQRPAAQLECRMSILCFAARSLAFLVPPPAAIRLIIDAFLKCLVGAKRLPEGLRGLFTDTIVGLAQARHDNTRAVAKSMSDMLKNAISSMGNDAAAIAFEVGLDGEAGITVLAMDRVNQPVKLFSDLRRDISAEYAVKRVELARVDRLIAFGCYNDRLIALKDLIGWHGVSAVVSSPEYRLLAYRCSPILFRWMFGFGEPENYLIKECSSFGAIVERLRVPLMADVPSPEYVIGFFDFFVRRGTEPNIAAHPLARFETDATAQFGLVVGMACWVEMTAHSPLRDSCQRVLSIAGVAEWLRIAATIILGRFNSSDSEVARAATVRIESFGFSEKQKQILTGWVRNEISFIGAAES